MGKYKAVKQNDQKDCGAACLATILRQYKSKILISKIRDIVGTDEGGTNVFGIVSGLEHFCYEAKALRVGMEIFDDKSLPYPAIAHVVQNGNLLHFVVIHKACKKYFLIADPGKGLVRVKREDFEKEWTGVIIFTLPEDNYEPLDQSENSLLKVLKILFIDKLLVFHIIIASIVCIILSIVSSFYFQTLIDSIIPQSMLNTLHMISIGLIAVYIFSAVFETVRNYLLAVLGNRMSIRVMLGYYKHVLKLPMGFFATRKSGEIISRFMDASKVIDALASSVLTVILDVSMVLIIGCVMFYQSTTLFFITLFTIPFFTCIILAFIKIYKKANQKEMEANSILNSYIIESLNGIETIKAYQSENTATKRTDKLFADYVNANFSTFNIDNIQKLLKIILQTVSSTIILWIGSTLVIKGEMSIGQLITFNTLASYFNNPLQNIINLQPQIQTAKVAADRIDDVLVVEPEFDEKEDSKLRSDVIFDGPIKINNLSFNYPMKRTCLAKIDVIIKKGEKVSFVGSSGSGKSTLAKLLVSFYSPVSGDILFNKYNIEDINKSHLRKNVLLLPQSAFFFSGTILENLTFGISRKVELDEAMDACKIAQIDDFINDSPLRYASLVEENGCNLSGGQKQRLAIARALLRNPKVLILDEATSSIDATAEKAIINELFAIKDMTVIVIAHRLSILTNCDNIYVLENNTIVENGTHEYLLSKKSAYYRMWNV